MGFLGLTLVLLGFFLEAFLFIEGGVHLHHALGELNPRQLALLINGHPFEEVSLQKLAHVTDLLAPVVVGEGLQVKVDPVGEVEVSGTALDHQFCQLGVGQVLLNDHVGDDLRHEVLQIVPLQGLRALNDGVDALQGQQLVDLRGRAVWLV